MSTEVDVLTELEGISTTIWSALKENDFQNVKVKEFRIIINCYKKLQTSEIDNTELTQLSDRLLQVLTCGKLNLDCQIVASTAYCLTLTYHHGNEILSQKFLQILSPTSVQSHEINKFTDVKIYDMFRICLSHGILQCNSNFCFMTNNSYINDLLNNQIFPIVCKLCLEYNSLCLISFKVLVNLIKKINTIEQVSVQLSEVNFKKVINIIMSNWENPLSGVREQNLLVFEQILMTNKDCWPSLPVELSSPELDLCPLLQPILLEQSWRMKSKYFLLSAVLRICGVKKLMSIYEKDIVTGLLVSLKFSQLVSAGSDLYQVITSAFTLDQWKNTFLPHISETLVQPTNGLQTENLINYWLPYTIKQYPSSLACLLEQLKNNINLFTYISLMKLARKEGFDLAAWNNLNSGMLLIPALLSSCDKIRSQAFSLICVSSKSSIPPSGTEIKLVKTFLRQNVNVDNAAMRQSLLNAFTTFLLRLKDSSLKDIKKYKNIGASPIADECLDFLKWLHDFTINNFQPDCNYQRKFTSLQIYSIVLNSFCFKLSSNTISKHSKKTEDELISNIGRMNGKWKFTSRESQNILICNIYDSADDIRTISAEILTSYFVIEESDIKYYKELLQNSLILCKNPMFYQAESGVLLFQTIITLISNSTSTVKNHILCGVFGDTDTVLDYLIKSIKNQFEEFSEDMLKAIMNGSSLYGLLGILEKLFSNQNGSDYKTLSEDQIGRVILLIENVVSLLLSVLSAKSDKSSDFAPSFAEMGMAISSLVQQYSVVDENIENCLPSGDIEVNESNLEELQLTPNQQLVLNCIWHNMKVCCSIASKLIPTPCISVINAKRCMDLLCLVLCKCRHKGAIESAGLAIYQATRFLTSSEKLDFRNIPRELLFQFLHSLISANATTISRRSAGLAILVHRIAAGDMEQGKPLLHICVSRFVKVFENFKEPKERLSADLPQSQALHFLQTLVQDSSLRQEMAKYIVEISLLCFAYLGSSIWTLRNAALQLFGALLPKLTGQKKLQEGESHSSCYHLNIEELYFHFKPLFVMMANQLSLASGTSSLQIHSGVMPLLTLLSNLTVSFQNYLNIELCNVCKDFSDKFQSLFKSEIYNVRELSAKANAWFCLPSEILDRLHNRIDSILGYVLKNSSSITNNNELHGYLLNVKYLVDRFNETKVGNSMYEEEMLKTSLKQLLVIIKLNLVNQHYLICNVIIDIIGDFFNKPMLCVSEITEILTNFPVTLGIYCWADFNLKCVINNCDSESIKSVLKFCILSDNFDINRTSLHSLRTRIKRKKYDDFGYIIDLLNDALHSSSSKSQIVELILEIMLDMLNSGGIFITSISIDSVYDDILYNSKYGSKCCALVLPVVCGIIGKLSYTYSNIDKISTEILQRSNPIFNEELRMSAANSLCFIFPVLKTDCDSIGSSIWKSAVRLIRDEDKDIRLETSKFVFKIFNLEFNKWIGDEFGSSNLPVIENCNPFVALEFLFRSTCLKRFMTKKCAVLTMWEMLTSDSSRSEKSIAILNPFSTDKNNIYDEEVILLDMIQDIIIELLKNINEENFAELKEIILNQANCIEKEFKEMNITSDDDRTKLKKHQCRSLIVNLLMERTK